MSVPDHVAVPLVVTHTHILALSISMAHFAKVIAVPIFCLGDGVGQRTTPLTATGSQ